MLNGRIPLSFTTVFLSLSIILIMVTMIKDCDGSMAACNGSSAAECQVIEDKLQEFLMDTEEHSRILQSMEKITPLSYKSFERYNQACQGHDCSGKVKYNVAKRPDCTLYNRCDSVRHPRKNKRERESYQREEDKVRRRKEKDVAVVPFHMSLLFLPADAASVVALRHHNPPPLLPLIHPFKPKLSLLTATIFEVCLNQDNRTCT